MKTFFIVSDIHAQYDMLIAALNRAGFDIDNLDHIMIIAGDVLDRGKQGDQLIRYLENLIIQDRLLGVLGNHDKFLIEVVRNTFNINTVIWNCNNNGFIETLKLGVGEKTMSIENKIIKEIGNNIRTKYPIFIQWLLQLPVFLEFNKHVIVHGFLDFSLDDWRDTSEHYAIWERGYASNIPDSFQKKIIFGHTPNHYINGQNKIIYDGRKIMIDGGAASGIQINILQLNEDEI